MDYIQYKYAQLLALRKLNPNKSDELVLQQSRLEFCILLLLAYYWGKNFRHLNTMEKSKIAGDIVRPTIGQVVHMLKYLERGDGVTASLWRKIEEYPELRNSFFGHGFTFADAQDDRIKQLGDLYKSITKVGSILSEDLVLIRVEASENGGARGFMLKSSGGIELWNHPRGDQFAAGHSYAMTTEGDYFEITPFVNILEHDSFWTFRCVSDPICGRIQLNRLLGTGSLTIDWPALKQPLEEDEFRKVMPNGTVATKFVPNYKKYINIPSQGRLLNFLCKSKASVAATLWGHGGVGKTATVQNICDRLCNEAKREFDYIIFTSAKDRQYDVTNGSIISYKDVRVKTFNELITHINRALANPDTTNVESIVNSQNRMFIVIDDFETFSPEDQKRITSFVQKLNVNFHKVIITTRAKKVAIGEQLESNELSESDTNKFVRVFLEEEYPERDDLRAKLDDDLAKKIYEVTSGRPLFIIHVIYLMAHRGIEYATSRDIKSSPAAVNFLYGRIFSLLSKSAQLLFIAIGQLVKSADRTDLVSSLQFVTNLERDDAAFETALAELEKLKLIEREGDLFVVYSSEILEIMKEKYQAVIGPDKGMLVDRLKFIQAESSSVDDALLKTANAARYSDTEIQVYEKYRHIVNRSQTPMDIKLRALLNLADYLFNERGNKEKAVETLRDYDHEFGFEASYVKQLSNYLWATHSRDKAIAVLKAYFQSDRAKRLENDEFMELSGLAMIYFGISAIDQKETIKAKLRMREIDEVEYRKRNREIRRDFLKLFEFSQAVFERLKDLHYSMLGSGARHNLEVGYLQVVDVCVRLDSKSSYDFGERVCRYFLRNASQHTKTIFLKKAFIVQDLRKGAGI